MIIQYRDGRTYSRGEVIKQVPHPKGMRYLVRVLFFDQPLRMVNDSMVTSVIAEEEATELAKKDAQWRDRI